MNKDNLREIEEIKGEIRNLENKVFLLEQKILYENTVNSEISNSISLPIIENNNGEEIMPPFKEKVKKKQNFEQKVGKNIMGVLASILIFLGLLSFVALVYKNMTDGLKIFLMYLFSSGLMIGGLWSMKRNNNTFSKALTSCGIGSVFISLLLSRFYFDIIGDLTLFFLMLLWSLFSFFLFYRLKSGLFLIISYIGFSLALILSCGSVYIKSCIVYSMILILHSCYIGLLYIANKNNIIDNENYLNIFNILSSIVSVFLVFYGTTANIIMITKINLDSLILLFGVLIFIGINFVNYIQRYNKKSVLASILLIFICVSNIFSVLVIGNNVGIERGVEVKPIGYYLMDIKVPEDVIENKIDVVNYAAEKLYLKSSYRYQEGNIKYLYDFENEKEIIRNDDIALLSFIFALLCNLGIIVYLDLKNKSMFMRILKYLLGFILSIVVLCNDSFYVMNMIIGLLPFCVLLLYFGFKNEDNDLIILSVLYFINSLFFGIFRHTSIFNYSLTHLFALFSILHIGFLLILNYFLLKRETKCWDTFLYIVDILALYLIVIPIGDFIGEKICGKYILEYYPLSVSRPNYYFENGYNESLRVQFGNYFSTLLYFICNFLYIMSMKFFGVFKDKMKEGLNTFRGTILYVINKIYNNIVLLVGIGLLYNFEFNLILRFIVLLFCFALCVIDFNKLVYSDKKWVGFYICLKTTIFMNLVLNSYLGKYDIDYIYSVVSLFLAVLFIIFGFKIKSKSFRLSGLWLSIFAVLKLLLIDISYTNSFSRVISLIIGGLICFIIVWIYNKMSENTESS